MIISVFLAQGPGVSLPGWPGPGPHSTVVSSGCWQELQPFDSWTGAGRLFPEWLHSTGLARVPYYCHMSLFINCLCILDIRADLPYNKQPKKKRWEMALESPGFSFFLLVEITKLRHGTPGDRG